MSDYTILSEAERRAAENGTEQAEEEGRLVEYHQRKMHDVLQYHKAERASRAQKVAYLREQLELEEAALALIDSRIDAETEHDRVVLAGYVANAPQYRDSRAGRTFPFAWGPLQLKTLTTRQGAAIVDEQAVMDMFPEFIGYKPKWGDLRKARIDVDETGRVTDKLTGEIIPPEIIAGTPRQSQEQAFVVVDGVKFDLYGMSAGKDNDEEAETDGDGNDPFDEWA